MKRSIYLSIKQFFNAWKSSNNNNAKFTLLFKKLVYLYELMDGREKSNEKLLPEKEELYSHLIMEDTTDVDYVYAKRICK